MNAELLTDADCLLEFLIVFKGKCYDDLVKLMLGKYVFEISQSSQNLDPMIGRTGGHMLIEHADDVIAPLGILPYPVHVFLGTAGVADQKDMLDVIAFLAESLEDLAENASVQRAQEHIQEKEDGHHATRIVDLTHDVESIEHQGKDSDDVGLDKIEDLRLTSAGSPGRIDVTEAVDQDIAGDNKRKQVVIIRQLKIIPTVRRQDIEFDKICKDQ